MNMIVPIPFEPADGDALNHIAVAIVRAFTGRQTSEVSLITLGKRLDATVAANPDEADRAYLDAVGEAFGIDPAEGFARAFQRRIDIAEQDALQDAWMPCVHGKSPVRLAPDTWRAVEDAAQRMLERVRAVAVEVAL